MLIQLVLILILLGALAMTWRRSHQDVISRGEAVLWSLLWIGAGFIIMQPQTATLVANFFGVGRGSDFILYGAVVLLFVLVFKLFVAQEVIERKLTDMVRKDALNDIPKKF
jgi:small membrane protein